MQAEGTRKDIAEQVEQAGQASGGYALAFPADLLIAKAFVANGRAICIGCKDMLAVREAVGCEVR